MSRLDLRARYLLNIMCDGRLIALQYGFVVIYGVMVSFL